MGMTHARDDRTGKPDYAPPRIEVLGSLSQLTFGNVTDAQPDQGPGFLPSAAIMP